MRISSATPVVQARSFSCKTISDLCRAVYDYAMKIIQKIGDCFSRPRRPTPLNPPTTLLNPTTQRVTVGGPQNLIEFYLGREPNINGVRLNEICTWDDNRLESQHNYIQWLFPLRTPYRPIPTAPTLDDTTINAFRTNPTLRNNLLHSAFNRILRFYGLQMSQSANGSTVEITRAPNFNVRAAVWLTPYNHNFLRITRIIISLDLLGLPIHSRAFLAIMENIALREGNGIVEENLGYWRGALQSNHTGGFQDYV